MKNLVALVMIGMIMNAAFGQVDTSFVYSTGNPYGTLDIRIAKSATRYYYLQENKTFSFRESSGVRTNTYRDMTSWDSSPYTQGNLREKNGTSDYFIMNYRLLFPGNYNTQYTDGYPLIIMIHGAGERGNCWDAGCYWADKTWRPLTNSPAAPTTSNHELLNNDHNLLHGGQIHLSARNLAGNRLPNDPTMPSRAFPGFVLFPQNLNGWDANSAQDVIRLVRLISKKYNIDQNRIYIHGLSNGGYGTYEIIKRASWLIACALPMSAINDANITYSTYTRVLEDVSHIPLWIFQGGKDTNPVPSKTRSYVKKFQDAGMIVRYKEYPNLGHGVWNDAYNEPDFFRWMLEKNKANIHAAGGVAAICLTNGKGVKLSLAKGFLAYQWEYNGTLIEGADSAVYIANSPGVYRARFSRVADPAESQWNRWSDAVTVTESNPSQAEATQTGTLLLKDLNNYNDAKLNAVGDYPHYYWYKDGILVDLPGNQDDTTKHPVFKQGTCIDLPACTGNGLYTLVTAGYDNCPSPPSDAKQIYFNNQAPINVNAPGSFTGSSTSASSITLSWEDLSPNEAGFEIWRRKKLTTTTFSKWSMSALTDENVNTFMDTGLDPSSTYQYKIRAVNNEGRSNYTPSSSSQFLVVDTHADNIPPTIPGNVQAVATGIREITLTWESSIDNTGIRNYLIFFDNDTVGTQSTETKLVLNNLELNKDYSFTIKAVDLGNNMSEASNVANANTFMSGLYYEHSTGAWNDLDLIDWSTAEYEGKVQNFTLVPRTQEDYFNFKFQGYLYISIGGTYQFRTTSDDGSRLNLNGQTVVNNDGLHGNVTITSQSISLNRGAQFVEVKYFEYSGDQTLIVQYKGPDTNNSWRNVPDGALNSGNESLIATVGRIISPDEPVDPTLTAYPNPAKSNEDIRITMNGGTNNPIHLKLVNYFGETFYNTRISAEELNEGTYLRTRKPLKRGMYVLIIRQDASVIKQRILVD